MEQRELVMKSLTVLGASLPDKRMKRDADSDMYG